MGGPPGFPRKLLAIAVLGLSVAGAGPADARGEGALVQLPGAFGCLWQDEPRCAESPSPFLSAVAVSPDGRHLYAAAPNTIYTYERDPQSGALRRVLGRRGCVRHLPRRGQCGSARGMDRIVAIRLSPDGRHLYAASFTGPAVAVLERNPATGALRQLRGSAACVSRNVRGCAPGRALGSPEELAVSPDGRNVYVAASGWGSVVVLQRNRETGALRQPAGPRGCLADARAFNCEQTRSPLVEDGSSIAVAPHGGGVVLATGLGGNVVTLQRGQGGLLSEPRGPDPPPGIATTIGMAVSPNGRFVYVTTVGGQVTVLRLRAGAHPVQLPGRRGCLHDVREADQGPCTPVRGLRVPTQVAASPDGANVYVAAAGGFVTLERRRDGSLFQPRGKAGCLDWRSITGCGRNRIPYDIFRTGIAVSRDGRNVYGVGDGLIEVFRRTQRR